MTKWITYKSKKDVPIMCGVYVIYIDGEVVYVGISKDIRKRFSSHHIKEWDQCKIKAMISVGRATELEERLIRKLNPPGNAYGSGRKEMGARHRVEIPTKTFISFRNYCNHRNLQIKGTVNEIIIRFLEEQAA
jgi:hypothetical protein